jgi:hypothetical protein
MQVLIYVKYAVKSFSICVNILDMCIYNILIDKTSVLNYKIFFMYNILTRQWQYSIYYLQWMIRPQNIWRLLKSLPSPLISNVESLLYLSKTNIRWH